MMSMGNDIVSLDAIDTTRTKNPKFYLKFLSETERSLYDQPGFKLIPFEGFVWLLWSIKEAAYKYLQRLSPDLVFTPISFKITKLSLSNLTNNLSSSINMEGTGFKGLNSINGVVTYPGTKLYTRSFVNDAFIHSVINSTNDFNGIAWGIKQINDNSPDKQSAAVRDFLLNRLKILYRLKNFNIIKSSENIPTVSGSDNSKITVSLSHHGCFVAYAFNVSD